MTSISIQTEITTLKNKIIICPICLELIDIVDFGNVMKTICNHYFCLDCMEKWLQQNKTSCPICRETLFDERYTDIDEIDEFNVRDIESVSSYSEDFIDIGRHNLSLYLHIGRIRNQRGNKDVGKLVYRRI